MSDRVNIFDGYVTFSRQHGLSDEETERLMLEDLRRTIKEKTGRDVTLVVRKPTAEEIEKEPALANCLGIIAATSEKFTN